ncbi:MAG TPA: ankyrin repeat domain-containing protein, partial [Bryobacteraceae bacterium]
MRGLVIAAALMSCAVISAQDAPDALLQAIRNNDLNYLRAELRKGANVNARDRRGSTLLMHAAIAGSPEGLKLLLDAGAEVNAKNSFDETALILAAGDARKARMLIEKGADVNAHSKPR